MPRHITSRFLKGLWSISAKAIFSSQMKRHSLCGLGLILCVGLVVANTSCHSVSCSPTCSGTKNYLLFDSTFSDYQTFHYRDARDGKKFGVAPLLAILQAKSDSSQQSLTFCGVLAHILPLDSDVIYKIYYDRHFAAFPCHRTHLAVHLTAEPPLAVGRLDVDQFAIFVAQLKGASARESVKGRVHGELTPAQIDQLVSAQGEK